MESSSVFEKVVSTSSRERYEKIWIPSFRENNIQLDCSLDKMEEFIVKKDDIDIGTVAFLDYHKHSEINDVCNFFDLDYINENIKDVVEIDYVTISRKYRGEADCLKRLLYSIFYYAISRNKQFGVILFNPTFYILLSKFYKIPLKRIKTKDKEDHLKYVPCILSMKDLIDNLHNKKLHFIVEYAETYNPEILDKILVKE